MAFNEPYAVLSPQCLDRTVIFKSVQPMKQSDAMLVSVKNVQVRNICSFNLNLTHLFSIYSNR